MVFRLTGDDTRIYLTKDNLFPSGGHGLSLGTAETAWQGVHGIEECVQVWPQLAAAWMRRTFAK